MVADMLGHVQTRVMGIDPLRNVVSGALCTHAQIQLPDSLSPLPFAERGALTGWGEIHYTLAGREQRECSVTLSVAVSLSVSPQTETVTPLIQTRGTGGRERDHLQTYKLRHSLLYIFI